MENSSDPSFLLFTFWDSFHFLSRIKGAAKASNQTFTLWVSILSGVMVDDNGDGGEIPALVFVGTYFYGIYKATKLARGN